MSAAIAEFQSFTHPQRHLTLVPQPEVVAARGAFAQMRITRRGRVARTIAIFMAIGALAVATLMMVSPASAAIEVEVQPGQTLSEIAATHLPNMPLDRAIVAVQVENSMNSAQVQTGQRLLIP